MTDRYILDAWAILALLGSEPGSEKVVEVLSDPDKEVFVSALNVGEVFYILVRRRGPHQAREVEAALYDHPQLSVVPVTRDRIRTAADVKASGGLSFPDSFAVALAREVDGSLVTGDPEFLEVERQGAVRLHWLGDGR